MVAGRAGDVRRRGFFDQVDVLRTRPAAGWRDGIAAAEIAAADGGRSRLAQAQATDMADWLPHDLLLKLDRCLMAHAVEGRTPFLDRGVAAAAFRLPDGLKLHKGLGKWLLRALAGEARAGGAAVRAEAGFHRAGRRLDQGPGRAAGSAGGGAAGGGGDRRSGQGAWRCSATSAGGGTGSRRGSCCSTRCGTARHILGLPPAGDVFETLAAG